MGMTHVTDDLTKVIQREPLYRISTQTMREVCDDLIAHMGNQGQEVTAQMALKKVIAAIADVHWELDVTETQRSINEATTMVRAQQNKLAMHEKRLALLREEKQKDA